MDDQSHELTEAQEMLIATYATGALDEADANLARQLIASHPTARKVLRAYEQAVTAGATNASGMPMPDNLKAGVLDRIRTVEEFGTGQQTAKQPSQTEPERIPWPFWRRKTATADTARSGLLRGAAVPVLAAAAMMLAVVGFSQQQQIGNLSQELDERSGEVSRLQAATDMIGEGRVVPIRTSGLLENTDADLWVWKDEGILVMENLPDPREDRSWQLWGRNGDNSTSRLAQMTRADNAVVMALGNLDYDRMNGLMITEEPLSASGATPTGGEFATAELAELRD